jgi:hypothetical protein
VALETSTYIVGLVTTNPDGGDQRSTADDHVRLLKAVLKRTFPLMDGAVSLSSTQLMYLGDLSASVQVQLNTLRDGSATANNAVNSRFANSASIALYANSASYAGIAATANSASYAALAGQASSASYATLAATANSASYAALASHAASASFATFATTATSATTATTATNATNATNAALATTASNANTVGGYAASEAATASTVAARNASGYIFAVHFNSSGAVESSLVATEIIVGNGSGYFYKTTPANAGQYIDAKNISTKTGTAKTLSSSSPSGGSNGDIWYEY